MERYILYQVANEKTSIRSYDKCAYVRILGSFPNKYLAQRYCDQKLDPEYEVRIAPERQWRLIMNQRYDETINAAESEKYDRLMEFHTITRETKEAAVRQAVEKKEAGELSNAAYMDSIVQLEILDTNVEIFNKEYPKVPGQNFCVIAVIPDYENKIAYEAKLQSLALMAEKDYTTERNKLAHNNIQEAKEFSKTNYMKEWSIGRDTAEIPGDSPMFMVLGTFDTEEAAKEFLEAYQDHKDVAKACISMYHFVKVRAIETVLVQRHYQDTQQQQLMDALYKARKLSEVSKDNISSSVSNTSNTSNMSNVSNTSTA